MTLVRDNPFAPSVRRAGRARPDQPVARRRTPAASPVAMLGQGLGILAALLLCFFTQVLFIGGLQHARDQIVLHDELRTSLAEGTADISSVREGGDRVPDGTPIGILEIPRLGVSQVVGLGSNSEVLMSGPGLRRDSVMPGQAGTSFIMGRRLWYGGPFLRLSALGNHDEIIVTTGQDRNVYRVTGVRRAGDPLPAPPTGRQGRLILATADGSPYLPRDVLRVDAELTSPVRGATKTVPVPGSDKPGEGDPRGWLPFLLWSQALLLVTLALVWIRHRTGRWQAWVIGVPVLGSCALGTADAAVTLLPNLF